MHPDLPLDKVFQKLGLALLIGLLIGLQRERVHAQLGGIRTYALVSALGAVCALLSIWLVGAALLALGALLLLGNLIPGEKRPDTTPGITTEVTMLLTLVLGAYSVDGYKSVTVALGGAVAFLLHAKAPLHKFVERMGEQDVWAIMQFVLIALVIWPVLPDHSFGPYQVLNPHNIWLMVVLIVGISL